MGPCITALDRYNMLIAAKVAAIEEEKQRWSELTPTLP